MAKISDEEYQEMQADKRHDELIKTLKALADRSNVDELVKKVSELVEAVQQQKPEVQTIDLTPLLQEIAELKAVLSVRLKALNVERSSAGLIKRIVPEY